MPKLKLPAFLSRLNTKGNKRKLLLLVAVIVIGVIAWAVYDKNVKDNGKLLAESAGHKIYEQEVKDFIGDNTEVTQREAVKVLADKYFLEVLAKEDAVTVSEQEIKEQYGTDAKKYTGNNYGYQFQFNELYTAKLQAYNAGIYKGKYLVGHFSRYVAYDSPLLYEDKQIEPKIGDKAAIAQDKKHAQDLINDLYNKIKSGELTFAEAAKVEKADPVVGKKAYPSLSHSGSFDTSINPNGLVVVNSSREILNQLTTGEISKPFVVRASNSSSDKNSTAESYFLVVQLDQKSGGGNTDFDKYIEEAKQRLGYKLYI